MDFLHELDVKRFEAVPSWGDEEEAGMDEGIGEVTSLDLSFQSHLDSTKNFSIFGIWNYVKCHFEHKLDPIVQIVLVRFPDPLVKI